MSRTWQPPTLDVPLAPDLNSRFKNWEAYWARKFFPYVFDYFTTVTVLDQVRCNATLQGVQDGTNTDFHLAAGSIRLAPDGTPLAILAIASAGSGPVTSTEETWVPLVGVRDGVNTNFTIATGTVAFGTNGNPLASLFQGGGIIPYTSGAPGAFAWTMSGQTFVLGTPPTGVPTDEPIVSWIVLA